jgi:hypothetical protein
MMTMPLQGCGVDGETERALSAISEEEFLAMLGNVELDVFR